MSDTHFVNGPINVIRLENTSDYANKKVLYIFMDRHTRDSKCDDGDNIDIDNFFANEFSTIESSDNLVLDFFMEIEPIELVQGLNSKQTTYIGSVSDFFSQGFGKYINIRFHAVDIRRIQYNLYKLLQGNPGKESLDHIMKIISHLYKSLFENMEETAQNDANIFDQDTRKVVSKVMHKIGYKYKNPDIKNKVNTLLDHYVKPLFSDVANGLFMLTGYVSEELLSNIKLNILVLLSDIMDIYILRRFLDKDYVSNAVTYLGADHGVHLVYLLVKYFDFSITHMAKPEKFSKKDSLSKLNQFILQSSNFLSFYQAFSAIIGMERSIQCCDMRIFPQNFR